MDSSDGGQRGSEGRVRNRAVLVVGMKRVNDDIWMTVPSPRQGTEVNCCLCTGLHLLFAVRAFQSCASTLSQEPGLCAMGC
jgi:hypothetical protein